MWQHSRAERYKTLSTHIKKTMGGMPRIILTAAQSQQPAATSQDLLDCVIKTLKGARKARAARRRALLPRRTSVHCFLMGLAVALVALASVGIGADAAKTRSWQQWPALTGWAIGKPSARHRHRMAATDNGTVWMLGGTRITGDSQPSESSLFKLDVKMRQWTTMTTTGLSPSKRAYHAMTAAGTSVWIHGGASTEGAILSEENQDSGIMPCRLHRCAHLCGCGSA